MRRNDAKDAGNIAAPTIEFYRRSLTGHKQLLDDEATVKYYQPRRDRIELVAANAKYKPILIERGNEFRILGVVKGVLRVL